MDFIFPFNVAIEPDIIFMMSCEKSISPPYIQKWLLYTLKSGFTEEINQIAVSKYEQREQREVHERRKGVKQRL